MRCAISYHLYDLKNVKNTHGGVKLVKLLILVLVKLLILLKLTLLHGCFSRFSNCTKVPNRATHHILPSQLRIVERTTQIGKKTSFNPFLANAPILYPLKTPENLWFSGVFRGYKRGAFARYVVLCAIWSHSCNLKNAKNIHRCFSRFLNCAHGTKSRNASHMG